jgi:hypothetical protein
VNNDYPKPLVWTATAELTLEKAAATLRLYGASV